MFRIETRELVELVVKCPLIRHASPRHEYEYEEDDDLNFFEKTLYEN